MIAAVVVSVGLMMLFARGIGNFVSSHPSIKMLALSFLLVVGVMLIAEASTTRCRRLYLLRHGLLRGRGDAQYPHAQEKSRVAPVDLHEPYKK
jgi:hypothetical protein